MLKQIFGNFIEKLFTKENSTVTQTFGDFLEIPLNEEHLTLGFSPSSIPIKERWRNNGLSADFMADYLTTFFPKDENDSKTSQRQLEIKDSVSYIANELLENAMKYCDDTFEYPITIHIQLESDEIRLFVDNSISTAAAEKFQHFIKEFTASDPEEFYFHQLENNVQEENTTGSGLGFVTMVKDYYAKVGWKFQTVLQDKPVITVTTMVQLQV